MNVVLMSQSKQIVLGRETFIDNKVEYNNKTTTNYFLYFKGLFSQVLVWEFEAKCGGLKYS